MEHSLTSTELLLLAFNIAIVVIGALGGWLVKGLFDRLKDLEKDNKEQLSLIYAIKVDLPQSYARRDDLNDALDKIFDAIRRIEDNLGQKADRRDHYGRN